MKKIIFKNPELEFTNVFYQLQKAKKRFVICYGGSGSSKSYSMHQLLILKSFVAKYDFLIAREHGTTLRNSIYKGIKERIFKWGLENFFDFTYSNDNRCIKNKKTGCCMIFIGLDDEEKLKSIEKIQVCVIEEANQTRLSTFLEINRRLRGIPDIQIFVLFNPVSVHHWLKNHFFDNKEVSIDCNFIKSTYLDNQFIDKPYIDSLLKLKTINQNDYRIYALGDWGIPSEGLIFKEVSGFESSFDCDKIRYCKYKELPKNIDFYEVDGLDFGGGGNPTDKPDGSSKNVLIRCYIDRDLMRIYLKLKLYRGFCNDDDIENLLDKKVPCVSDNARKDKIRALIRKGYWVIGAKSKEGKSTEVVTGYDFLRLYEIYVHEDDSPILTEFENHVWAKNKNDEWVDVPEDKFKDVADALRYAATWYHLTYNCFKK